MIAFEQERHPTTGQRVLTCILLPQTDSSMKIHRENFYASESSTNLADRPTILRFATDTIDEPVRWQFSFSSNEK